MRLKNKPPRFRSGYKCFVGYIVCFDDILFYSMGISLLCFPHKNIYQSNFADFDLDNFT